MSVNLFNALVSLRALVGAEEFATAVAEVLESPLPAEDKGKRGRGRPAKEEKKEKKTREPTDWNKFVRTVWEEMKQTRKKVKYSEAMTEATARRAAAKGPATSNKEAAAETEGMESGEAAGGEDSRSEEERKAVFRYLFELQDGGSINMLACVPYLTSRFGFDKYVGEDYRAEYMQDYSALKAKYGEAEDTPAAASAASAASEKSSGKKAGGRGKGKVATDAA